MAKSQLTPSPVGRVLRDWRGLRSMSQLDLALAAEVSSRHLSFVETGRAQPSRELLRRLGEALEIPLRAHNELATAAGFAAPFRETPLAHAELARARQALDLILDKREPYPAIVLDRHWNMMMGNDAAARLFALILPQAFDNGPLNIMRLMFDPEGARPYVVDWPTVARAMISRARREAATLGPDTESEALIEEMLSYPDVPRDWATPGEADLAPFLTVTLEKDGLRLSWFSTMTTFGTAQDITLQELYIESFFPADDDTATLAKHLAESDGTP